MLIPPVAAGAAATNPVGWVVLGVSAALTILPQLFKRDVDEDNAVAVLNQVEASLQQAMSVYFSNPFNAYDRQEFLRKFDEAYAWLTGPGIGQNTAIEDVNWRRQGVADRSRGGKYDWFSSMRDPVANDPRAQGAEGIVGGVIEPIAASIGVSSNSLLLWIGVSVVGLWFYLRGGK